MPQNPAPEPEQLLTPSEVAAMFRVNPKTVTRWAVSYTHLTLPTILRV